MIPVNNDVRDVEALKAEELSDNDGDVEVEDIDLIEVRDISYHSPTQIPTP